ncbi:hypothetical protein TanjilG_20487 [Lupinus angustifolius]|uniref:GDSL esterase/lipase n=1 Tax=Lupinus angustifolius TaxID=3871 RepID=A0A1J7HY73_LUPAN|nr:PREDICTED: GDSL esterase/lipase At5g03610-like [Lupinus angustifolius]OIW11338.1 hypothetical protein TanjilG_20487 [Lupinus angustifolius]
MYSYNKLFTLLSLFAILYLSGQSGFQVEGHKTKHAPKKLFVFGDSYCDTGNIKKDLASSWKSPYGVTFPGKPVGRFSDGRVFTDFFAKYLKLQSPLPFNLRKLAPQHLKYGINFAFGGTGAFDTSTRGPNLTTQIDSFEKLIKYKLYGVSDLKNSVALVSVAGNDYTYYLTTNGSIQGVPSFIVSLVNQTTKDLIRLKKLGVKKVVVDGLQPFGCLPIATAASSFQKCNDTANAISNLHNTLLTQSVAKLNQQNKDHPSFIILNLYDTFLSVLNKPKKHNIENPLKPCCAGVSSEYYCGSVDKNNVKKYTVCANPKKAFFWDIVHPSQAGWHAVFEEMKSTKALHQILH